RTSHTLSLSFFLSSSSSFHFSRSFFFSSIFSHSFLLSFLSSSNLLLHSTSSSTQTKEKQNHHLPPVAAASSLCRRAPPPLRLPMKPSLRVSLSLSLRRQDLNPSSPSNASDLPPSVPMHAAPSLSFAAAASCSSPRYRRRRFPTKPSIRSPFLRRRIVARRRRSIPLASFSLSSAAVVASLEYKRRLVDD
ncbi:hypothetical protein LINPERHAP1_LOCUS30994, partial [Linum perenne]